MGQQEKAASDFTKVTEISPLSAEGYLNLGQIYLAKDEYEQALADFIKVIEIDSKNAQAYFCRMLIYFALGDYDKAWNDVHNIESLGRKIPNDFISVLRQFSNRRN